MRISRALVVCVAVASTAAALLPGDVAAQSPGAGSPSVSPVLRWPVRTLSHVDLWLHGFALLADDSTEASTAAATGGAIPLYKRGYRDSLTVEKNRRNVLTSLDGNRATLTAGLRRAGGYLEAQFLPYEFGTWEEMRQSAELFLQAQGDPRRIGAREGQMRAAPFAAVFTSAADREWLRLFITSLDDERIRFFEPEYKRVFRERSAVITAVDSLWQQVARAKFERFLNNSGQRQGDVLLTLPIGGEGRTTATRAQRTMVSVPFPGRPEDAAQVLHVLAHEVTGSLVGPVVADNVTPAETREGAAARHVSVGQVVAGALLLARIAPELESGYQRYYLQQAGAKVPATGEVRELFAQRFALPAAIRDALVRQLDLVLGGI